MKNEKDLTDLIINQVQIFGAEYDVFFFGSARAREPGPRRRPKRKNTSVLRIRPKKI
jgi:hypothetical protein